MTQSHSWITPLLAVATVIVVITVGILFLTPSRDLGPEGAVAVVEPTNTIRGEAHLPSAPLNEGTVPEPSPDTIQSLPQNTTVLNPNDIILRVVDDATGNPIPDFQLFVLPPGNEPPMKRAAKAIPERVKQRTGLHRIQRNEGVYDIVVHAVDYMPAIHEQVSIPPPTRSPLEIRLSRGAGILGQVTMEGFPAKGIQVFLHVTFLKPGGHQPRRSITVTDNAGQFRFSPLSEGEYAVTLLEPGNMAERYGAIQIKEGTIQIHMDLIRRHQLTVEVRNTSGTPLNGALVEISGPGTTAQGHTNTAGLVILDHLLDASYELRVASKGFGEVKQSFKLTGGSGFTVKYIRLSRE